MAGPLVLLGLLGAAGAAGAGANRMHDRRVGREFAEAGERAGVDMGIMDADSRQAYEMAAQGRISPQQYLDTRHGFLDQRNTMLRHRENLGFDYANLGESQRQFNISAMNDLRGEVMGGDGLPVNHGVAYNSLIGLESGGNPGAVSAKGASGLSQIMPDNIVPWSRKHGLGAGMTDDEIRKAYATNPEFQYRLGAAEFGRYVDKYGYQEALVKWHAGEGTTLAMVMEDYLKPPEERVYHDGNMHTLDYVRAQSARYARAMAEVEKQREIANMKMYLPESLWHTFEGEFATPQSYANAKEVAAEAELEAMRTGSLPTLGYDARQDIATDAAKQATLTDELAIRGADETAEADWRNQVDELANIERDVNAQLVENGLDPRTLEPIPGSPARPVSTPGWQPAIELTGKQQADQITKIRTAERAIGTIQDALEFVGPNSTWMGRWLGASRPERQKMATRLQGDVVEAIRRLEEKGVLQKDEAERVEARIGGDLTGFERRITAELTATLTTLQALYNEGYQEAALSIDPAVLNSLGLPERIDVLPGSEERPEGAVSGVSPPER